jgi:uncharacterized protein with FMN-binding domain
MKKNNQIAFGCIVYSLSAMLSCSKQDAESMVDLMNTFYNDGVYSARGEYGGQPSHITVSLTLSDAIISGVSVTTHATDPTSLDYQQRFAAAVPAVVNGKHISEVNVGRLAGSSGTPVGFNDAIRQIRLQAARP